MEKKKKNIDKLLCEMSSYFYSLMRMVRQSVLITNSGSKMKPSCKPRYSGNFEWLWVFEIIL
jgi:hypothetical protein